MKGHEDLIGKTITGVMAVPTADGGPLKIWMLQFSDGTHVEFVSPGARRALERLARGSGSVHRRRPLAGAGGSQDGGSVRCTQDAANGAMHHRQLALNVA